MAEAPDKDKKADKKPEPEKQVVSGRVTVTLVSLAALAIGGAAIANSLPATANFLPSFSLPSFPLPDFNRFTLPKLDRIALPNFNRAPAPKSDRVAAPIPPKPTPAPVLVPDPFVHAALIDIQQSQQQSAAVLASLTQDSANQQADLRRISRQLSTLAARVEALNGTMGPLTTSSIPHSNPRARIIRTARRAPRLLRRRPLRCLSLSVLFRSEAPRSALRLAYDSRNIFVSLSPLRRAHISTPS